MKKGAIFDMDGLLFDTERIYKESWEAVAGQFGQVHNPAFPTAVAGTSGAGMVAVIRKYYPAVEPQAFIQACMDRAAAVIRENLPEKPGIREILSFFRERGVPMAVASSSVRELVDSNLSRAGILDFFDAVVGGQEVARSKPDPDIFLLAAEKIGVAPTDCYVFEDGINGARAGVAAGCATVMIPDFMQPTDDLRQNCAGIYASLLEARDAIAAGAL